ncbi:N-acetylmuramoyl-L-alanine amidase [Halostreptopolyspora alba]|uniref:N-acetylmuramoyl-L-alanine amidase n=2 Tax=Halostreptopolyspora alba TaxID=2487137 RepID=A0A3N0E5Y2_9ACTN|nr:N-acetylmuramoyl-L-alanine amidase [Nocardiopsaceae bacterium YIM 96095]
MLRGAALAGGGVLLGGATALGGATRSAHAAAEPHVHTRANWGARRPRRRARVLGSGPDHIVVHHTATANTSDTSTSHAAALSRSIQRYHMDTNGWDDIGQQLTISRGGHVMEGRNTSLAAIRAANHTVGAHTAYHNSHTIGIENEGTYSSATPPEALMASLAETCAWLCAVYNLDPSSAIVGHRDYNATSCPGDRLYAMLPELRSETRTRMRAQLVDEDLLDGSEVPEEHRPSYPERPMDERRTEHFHGPALGEHGGGS